MSLPPQTLTIKRKRDDDPVDELHLKTPEQQQEEQRQDGQYQEPKRRITEHAYTFRRLAGSEPVSLPEPAKTGIPQICTTLAGEENSFYSSKSHNGAGTSSVRHEAANVDQSMDVTQSTDGAATAVAPTPAPRVYRLSRMSGAPVKNNRKDADRRLAVFVEEPKCRKRTFSHATDRIASNDLGTQDPPDTEMTTPRKRSTARIVKRALPDRPRTSEEPSAELQEAMQRAAVEMEAERLHHLEGTLSQQEVEVDSDAMDVDVVFDTFERVEYTAVVGSTTMDTTAASKNSGRIGYLMIEEEDKPLWETYADNEDESDQDWDSEQDDENAENFYGADYPEDEVAEEDEYNHHAYKYRHKGAADEEEFDSDSDVWDDPTDTDFLEEHPWKRKQWQGPEEFLAGAKSDSEDEDS